MTGKLSLVIELRTIKVIWNHFELLKQHLRMWCFLQKYHSLDFALQIHANVWKLEQSPQQTTKLPANYKKESLRNAQMGGVMLEINNLLLNYF